MDPISENGLLWLAWNDTGQMGFPCSQRDNICVGIRVKLISEHQLTAHPSCGTTVTLYQDSNESWFACSRVRTTLMQMRLVSSPTLKCFHCCKRGCVFPSSFPRPKKGSFMFRLTLRKVSTRALRTERERLNKTHIVATVKTWQAELGQTKWGYLNMVMSSHPPRVTL